MNTPDNPEHEADSGGKPFIQHLEDLRKMLIRSLVALGLGIIAAIPLAPDVLDILKHPLAVAGKNPAEFLRVLEITGGFKVAMILVILTGLLFSAPFISIFVAGFVAPALTRLEKTIIGRYVFSAIGLFVAGALLCYFAVLPVGLKVMLGIGSWLDINMDFVRTDDYISFCLYLILAFGLTFELPVVLVLLGRLGVVSSNMLASKRSYVIVTIFFLAMIITPTTDMVSQTLLAVPLIILFEISILLLRSREKREALRTGI